MVTPWTIPKLVTWRVKDWASCFVSSKFQLDEDAKKKRNTTRETRLSLSPRTEGRNKIRVSAENRRLSWPPHVSDEDYIVFCFNEDGVLDIADDDPCPPEFSSGSNHKAPRTASRKLTYDNQVSRVDGQKLKEEDEQDVECQENAEIISDVSKSEDEEETEETRGAEDEIRTDEAGESKKSNQSDGSRGSFAFPILGVEWIGSPVMMPRSEDNLRFKKQKGLSLGFQCCRF